MNSEYTIVCLWVHSVQHKPCTVHEQTLVYFYRDWNLIVISIFQSLLFQLVAMEYQT